MTATIAELGLDHTPWRWALAFDYDPAMVDAIKAHIPSRDRKWVPELREWHFKPGCLAAVQALCTAYCGGVTYVASPHAAPLSVPAETAAAYADLHLLPTAPEELVRAAYRVLCKRCHPDAGGEVATMQAINAAYRLLARSKSHA